MFLEYDVATHFVDIAKEAPFARKARALTSVGYLFSFNPNPPH